MHQEGNCGLPQLRLGAPKAGPHGPSSSPASAALCRRANGEGGGTNVHAPSPLVREHATGSEPRLRARE